MRGLIALVHGLIALALVAATVPSAAAQEPSVGQTPVIITDGQAVVVRSPDQAFVMVSVEARARNPRDAQRQNAEAMTAVQQKMTAAGLPKEALRTLGYAVQQEFDFTDGRRVPRDFLVQNSLEVRLDNVERVGEILDLVVQAGATSVAGVRFDLKDRAAAEREALRLAVADARARADAAAAGAGRTVDRVLRIEDARQQASSPRPMMAEVRVGGAQPSTPIEAGTIEVRAEVTLTVAIK